MASPKKRIALGLVVVAVAAAILWNTDEDLAIPPAPQDDSVPMTSPPPPATPAAGDPAPSTPGPAPQPVRSAAPPPAAGIPPSRDRRDMSLPAPSPEAAALEADLGQVELLIRHFCDVVGENPVGTNAEIMQAVLGDNLKQAKFEVPEGQTLNEKGELVDRWGTPYFFHQVSRAKMEIRSAGPDREMWTGDDMQL